MSRLLPVLLMATLLSSCATSQPSLSEAGVPATIPPPGPEYGDDVVAVVMSIKTAIYCRKTTYDRETHDGGNGRHSYGPWRLRSNELHRLHEDELGSSADPCGASGSSATSAH